VGRAKFSGGAGALRTLQNARRSARCTVRFAVAMIFAPDLAKLHLRHEIADDFNEFDNPPARRSHKSHSALSEPGCHRSDVREQDRTARQSDLNVFLEVIANVYGMSDAYRQLLIEQMFIDHSLSQVNVLVAHFDEWKSKRMTRKFDSFIEYHLVSQLSVKFKLFLKISNFNADCPKPC
jgi:hypothetical protein